MMRLFVNFLLLQQVFTCGLMRLSTQLEVVGLRFPQKQSVSVWFAVIWVNRSFSISRSVKNLYTLKTIAKRERQGVGIWLDPSVEFSQTITYNPRAPRQTFLWEIILLPLQLCVLLLSCQERRGRENAPMSRKISDFQG